MKSVKKWLPWVIFIALAFYLFKMFSAGAQAQATTPSSPNMGGMTS